VLERGDERELDALALLLRASGAVRSSAMPASGYGSSQTDSAIGAASGSWGSLGGP